MWSLEVVPAIIYHCNAVPVVRHGIQSVLGVSKLDRVLKNSQDQRANDLKGNLTLTKINVALLRKYFWSVDGVTMKSNSLQI